MDRGEFLERLFIMYPDSFTEKNKHGWLEGYKAVLKDPTIDYGRLFELVLTDWKYKEAPKTSWIYEKAKKCVEPRKAVADKKDWHNRYIITRWSQNSIWVSFTKGPSQNQEFQCDKEGEFEKICKECLKMGKGDCFDCCNDCSMGKKPTGCLRKMPCPMKRLVDEHNNREAGVLEKQND